PFSRGRRSSIFAAVNKRDVISWETMNGTFTRCSCHHSFVMHPIPILNP
ncbi:Transposase, partial [Phytophthora megakarya]